MLPRRKRPAHALGSLLRAPLILCGVLFLCLVSPTFAQDELAIKPVDGGLEVELAGHKLTMPLPIWATPSDVPIEQANVIYNELEPGVASLLMIPLEATIVTWTQMMGVLAVHREGYHASAQVQSIVEPMMQSCSPSLLYVSPLEAPRAGQSNGLLMLCGRYNPTAGAATRKCAGGIVLAVVMESAEGAAKVYLEWCTPAFTPTDKTSWPIAEATLAQYAANLQARTKFELLPASP
jgi:hypothetical protein